MFIFRGGREGGQKRGKPAFCLLLVLGREGGECKRRRRAAALPGGPFPVEWQRCNIVGPTHRSPAGAVCPLAASDGFACSRACVSLCFSTLCFLVIIPSKVTEISFVRQADRALSYYGIT